MNWCIAERAQHQTADMSQSQARDDAIHACHFTKLSTALQAWMKLNSIQNATIADETHSAGFGTRKADDPYPIASLTKAITATCIATLVESGRLNYTDRLETRLSSFLAANLLLTHKSPADPRVATTTIAEVLRHMSGNQNDPVAPPWASDIENGSSADEAFVSKSFSVQLATAPGTTYAYNNVNYAVLGMIIKQATNQSYEAFCKQAVLTPHPFSEVRIGAGIPALGAFGGWKCRQSNMPISFPKTIAACPLAEKHSCKLPTRRAMGSVSR